MKRVTPRPAKIPKRTRRALRRRAMEIGVPPEELFAQFRDVARRIEDVLTKPPYSNAIVVGENEKVHLGTVVWT